MREITNEIGRISSHGNYRGFFETQEGRLAQCLGMAALKGQRPAFNLFSLSQRRERKE